MCRLDSCINCSSAPASRSPPRQAIVRLQMRRQIDERTEAGVGGVARWTQVESTRVGYALMAGQMKRESGRERCKQRAKEQGTRRNYGGQVQSESRRQQLAAEQAAWQDPRTGPGKICVVLAWHLSSQVCVSECWCVGVCLC